MTIHFDVRKENSRFKELENSQLRKLNLTPHQIFVWDTRIGQSTVSCSIFKSRTTAFISGVASLRDNLNNQLDKYFNLPVYFTFLFNVITLIFYLFVDSEEFRRGGLSSSTKPWLSSIILPSGSAIQTVRHPEI